MYYYVLVYTVVWRRLAFFLGRSVTALKKEHRIIQKEGGAFVCC
jgi:hypothetical protein